MFFDNVELSNIARKHGTPVFVFSRRRLTKNVDQVRKAFGHHLKNTELYYAAKANSNLDVLRTLRRAGVKPEISSEGEMFLIAVAGFKPTDVIFNGPAKTRRELELAVRLGIRSINLDSIDELERLVGVCRSLRKRANISFRVLPYVHAGASIIQTGIHESKFGINYEEIVRAYRRALEYQDFVKPVGIHGHIGSQNTDVQSWQEFALKLGQKFVEVERELSLKLEHIDLGGGLPVRYARNETQQPMAEYLASKTSDEEIASSIAKGLEASRCRPITVIMEPGRRLVANSAVLLSRVVGTKQRVSEKWLYLDMGFNVTPSSRVLRWYYETSAAEKMSKSHYVPYRLAGPLCDSADVYHDWEGELLGTPQLPKSHLFPDNMANGDLVAMLDVGAYNIDLMNHFNGRLLPGAVMIDAGGRIKLIRKPENYSDLIAMEPHSKVKVEQVLRRMKGR